MGFLYFISLISGYLYFWIWALSLYPNIFRVWKIKNSSFISMDYVSLNFFSFFEYSLYTSAGYYWESTFSPETGVVDFSDVLYAYNAFFTGIVQYILSLVFPVLFMLGTNQTSKQIQIVIGFYIILQIFFIIASFIGKNIYPFGGQIGVVSIMGAAKVTGTTLKYAPQIYKNYLVKSTLGWHVWASYLDLSGGLLSSLQAIVDVIDGMGELNVFKFLVGMSSVIFNIILLVQHLCIYKGNQPHVKHEEIIIIQKEQKVNVSDKEPHYIELQDAAKL